MLILGETGSGKESVADAIHERSDRRNGPFLKVNCGAITPSLLSSELFGHEKGAFTGAHTTRRGYFEQANGGTLFLDEIGEMPQEAQVHLPARAGEPVCNPRRRSPAYSGGCPGDRRRRRPIS